MRALICLYNNHVSYEDIAFFLNRTYGSVKTKSLRLGIVRSRYYSAEEDRIVRQLSGVKSCSEIASVLGRSSRSVSSYCFYNRIPLMRFSHHRHGSFLHDDDVFLIKTLYDEGVSVSDISSKFDVSVSTVYDCLSGRRFLSSDYFLYADSFSCRFLKTKHRNNLRPAAFRWFLVVLVWFPCCFSSHLMVVRIRYMPLNALVRIAINLMIFRPGILN